MTDENKIAAFLSDEWNKTEPIETIVKKINEFQEWMKRMKDHVDLTPDDIIRSGDQYGSKTGNTWFNFVHSIGRKISDRHWTEWGDDEAVFRRPRSTLIRDASIELLKEIYFHEGIDIVTVEKLRESIGVTIQELRGGV